MSKQPILFCDFDGTITDTDNIIAIMKKFAPPAWEAIKENVLAQRQSIRSGVGQMFAMLPVALKEEIIQFVLEHARIRPGFAEFVQFAKAREIPLYIVSGGIDFFVYPMLDGYVDRESIYCNGSDFSGETIRILWPYGCDETCQNDCGLCKPAILKQFPRDLYHRIVIGDSITDLAAAKQADQVFARDFLVKKCEELGIAYTPFTTFHDILSSLQHKGVVA
ncbi:2-hydroxy-3-keto-5-methylthiopentenyl-1-phosphate phosphatase [Laceyella putida]|uniref:2-hydroxy-3-keto-5-methylthiopentenyl-1-phosphate phosphatase n=1 Tax=Laceyella putida TaxID=110101 RepID=A0ABW2RIE1_9BACL